jgi:hypothetical protein
MDTQAGAGGTAGGAAQGRNWWGPGLGLAFLAMLLVNGYLIWFAQQNADVVVPSYRQESR